MARNKASIAILFLFVTLGFAGSAVARVFLMRLAGQGISSARQFATVAEAAENGAAEPISFNAWAAVRDGWRLPGLLFAGYAEPVRTAARAGTSVFQVSVAGATPEFFSLTGGLAAGRGFGSGWERGLGMREAVIAFEPARRLFGSAAVAVGGSVILGGTDFVVVGVAAPGLKGLWQTADFWVTPDQQFALAFPALEKLDGQVWRKEPLLRGLAVLYRAPSDALVHGAADALRSPKLRALHLRVSPGLTRDPVADARAQSWARLTLLLAELLTAATAVNFTAVLLARSAGALEETRLKRILGAGAARICMESLVGPLSLALAAALAGSGLGMLLLRAMEQLTPRQGGSFSSIQFASIAALQTAACLFTAAVCGALPTLRLLREGGGPRLGAAATAGKRLLRALYGLAAVQIGAVIMVCLLAGMAAYSAAALLRERLGFAPEHLQIFGIGAAKDAANTGFFIADNGEFPLEAGARSLVDVLGGAMSSCALMGAPAKTLRLVDLGAPDSVPAVVNSCAVSGGYLPLLRAVEKAGSEGFPDRWIGNPSTLFINHALARQLGMVTGGQGRTLRLDAPATGLTLDVAVAGVIEDIRMAGPGSSPEPTVYLPLQGNIFTMAYPLYLTERRAGAPDVPSVDREVRRRMPGFAVVSAYSVEERVDAAFAARRRRAWAALVCVLLTGTVAALGLFGVIAFAGGARRKELAIRLCLGAAPARVSAGLLARAAACWAAGMAFAGLLWKPAAAFMAAVIQGTPRLPWGLALLVGAGTLAATLAVAALPARAAVRIPLAELLRE